ncbi:hypothetical protein [Phormidesmis sp. 146-33]
MFTPEELEKWRGLIKEYIRLHSLPCLNGLQERRLDQILELATKQPELSFLIQEVECLVAEELGELDEEHLSLYRNQQSKLSERYVEVSVEDATPHSMNVKSLSRAYYRHG